MVNCVDCGAPLGRAGDSCAACGAPVASGTTNGTPRPLLEDPDGLVYEDSPLLRDDADRATHRHEPPEPHFVRQPLQDDPTVRSPAFTVAPAAVASPVLPAPFTRRVIALLIDLAILSVLDVVLFALATSAVLLAQSVSGARVGDGIEIVRASVSAGSMTLLLGYFSVLHARSGQTLGKAAMRIHVADGAGGRIGIAPSVLRTFAYGLSALPFGAGFLLALGPAHRALHDRVAGTVVLRQGSAS